jgi:hypothetical protein
MTICYSVHSITICIEILTLIDLGTMENFMNLDYAKYPCLPIKQLEESHKLFNVDGTINAAGETTLE